MKSINHLEAITHAELVAYMATRGVIIEDITKDEIKEYYRNRLIPEKYIQRDMDIMIDNSDWIYKIHAIDGSSASFSNDENLVIYSVQAIAPVTVTHK